ncbi:hypothetical protein [Brevibacillus choshinensis]|uniref:hypothetical protein n=1 Tax=Brevibacillus choshinensis TaxID=54911 RepID=UPI002E22CAA4|nr:hypothetical protein [Brevibacillus choshinensis]
MKKKSRGERRDRISIWVSTNNMRARYLGLIGNLKTIEYRFIQNEIFGNKCPLTGSTNVVMGHMIPLNIGQGGGTSFINVFPFDTDLNRSMKEKNPFELLEDQKFQKDHPINKDSFDKLVSYFAFLYGICSECYKNYVYYCYDNSRAHLKKIRSCSREATPEERSPILLPQLEKPSFVSWKEDLILKNKNVCHSCQEQTYSIASFIKRYVLVDAWKNTKYEK